MRILGTHRDPRGKEKKKKVKKIKVSKLLTLVKKICREASPCIMANQGFGECGGNIQASHIKSVGAWPNLRLDPKNIFPKCYRHHLHIWHKDVTETGKWFDKTFPETAEYLGVEKIQQHIDFNNQSIIVRLFAAAKKGYEDYCYEYTLVKEGK